jgi:NTP pyrophosphatase (non-canonical NTP hydrolase)
MGYGAKSLNDLRDEAFRIAREHGFKDATPGEDIALMHSELSEALEDIRKGESLTKVWYEKSESGKPDTPPSAAGATASRLAARLGKPCGVPSEMADVIIRVLHFCGKHGIDIEGAVREKMAFNETREFRHGKKL